MELRDLIVTPLLLIIVYFLAYMIRPYVTDAINYRYFIPAFSVRILGALALGFIYQFYYDGGDTYNYHTHGSRVIWEAFVDSPEKGFELMFWNGRETRDIFQYSSRIYFLNDPSAYTIIRLAAIFDLITFSSYSATAVLFALISFVGSWMLFLTFYKEIPSKHSYVALATLFVPSVFFWGSGLMKDTVTLAALGVATYAFHKLFVEKRIRLSTILYLLLSFYLLFTIKKYILLCFLPSVTFWVFLKNFAAIRSPLIKFTAAPIMFLVAIVCAYYAAMQVSEGDSRYELRSLSNTARVTAYDIAFQSGREAGSTYTLGELDGSFSGMVRLAPQAISVSLFRPFLWEVRNPLMLLSAIEALIVLGATIYIVIKRFAYLPGALLSPNVIFCIIFSLTFAFAVGVSTFNFGTLSRYKIPLLPFFLTGLIFINFYSKSERKFATLDATE